MIRKYNHQSTDNDSRKKKWVTPDFEETSLKRAKSSATNGTFTDMGATPTYYS